MHVITLEWSLQSRRRFEWDEKTGTFSSGIKKRFYNIRKIQISNFNSNHSWYQNKITLQSQFYFNKKIKSYSLWQHFWEKQKVYLIHKNETDVSSLCAHMHFAIHIKCNFWCSSCAFLVNVYASSTACSLLPSLCWSFSFNQKSAANDQLSDVIVTANQIRP